MTDFDWQIGLKAIVRKHGLTLEQVKGKDKFRAYVAARRECYAYLRDRDWTLHRIAKLFNRDHTSILWLLYPEEKIAAKHARQRRYAAERRHGAMA